MSSPTLRSHTSYGSLKTIVGQVEQWVQRITNGAKAEMDAEREQCSADAAAVQHRGVDVTSAAQCRLAYAEQSCSSVEASGGQRSAATV